MLIIHLLAFILFPLALFVTIPLHIILNAVKANQQPQPSMIGEVAALSEEEKTAMKKRVKIILITGSILIVTGFTYLWNAINIH